MGERPTVFLLKDRLVFAADEYSGAHSLTFGTAFLTSLTGQPIRIERKDGAVAHCRNALFHAADVVHLASEAPVGAIYLYPASRAAIATGRLLGRHRLLPNPAGAGAIEPFREALEAPSDAGIRQSSNALLEQVLGYPLRDVNIDHRVIRVRNQLQEHPPRRVRLQELARMINLSGDRLTHLYSDETGVPLRSFALWCKAARAIEIFAQRPEADWATIAHEAGFSDLSHGIRTLKQYFGVSPSWVRGEHAPQFVFHHDEGEW